MPSDPSQTILNDLAHGIATDKPQDLVQYCADWFQRILKEERQGSSSASRSNPTASDTTNTSRRPPPAMAFPQLPSGAFNAHVSQPSPFSEHGPSDSPFGPSSSMYQRRATTAFVGGPAPIPSSGQAAPTTSNTGLGQLTEEAEDGSPASGGGGGGLFGGFSFNGQSNPQTSDRDDSPMRSARQPPPSSSSGTAHADELVPPAYALGRRTSVSAESLVPTAPNAAGQQSQSDADTTPTIGTRAEPKTASQLTRIKQSIAHNFLFRNLDEDQERDVLAAMKEVSVEKGEIVIEQGAAGDYFYVVESGSFDIFVKKADEQPAEGATDLERKWGKKVLTCNPGMSFGELALMYNAPRAATVIANEASTLWALDRISFRTILLDHTSRKRRMYESFLSTVSILSSLEGYERAKIADALESRTYQPGEAIVTEGEPGDEFFLIESGVAEVRKGDKVVGELGKGDYFGELALINRSPRAATVLASPTSDTVLRVATLGEKAFTRLLGPVKDIMARTAGERYGMRGSFGH